eukprot:scaffold6698_cov72-Cyclotella_meneghiniana.AAC.4
MMPDNNHACPGYQSIIDELLSLSKLVDQNAAPSAVLLSGCAGVGKSRMASLLERELRRHSSSVGIELDVMHISAKDVLLETLAYGGGHEGQHFNTLNNAPVNTSTIRRLVLIDDIDTIITHDDETDTANLESDKLRALHALVKLIDTIIQSSSSPRDYFIVGMSRTSLAQLPSQLARVSRFEKEVVMSPPSLSQRRDMFEFWLSTLPTKESSSVLCEWSDLLAPRTAGCVASDIRRICADALTAAVARESHSLDMILSLDSLMQDTKVGWSDVREAARTCIPSQLASMDVIPAKLGYLNDDSTIKQLDAKDQFELAWKDFGGYNDMKIRLFRTVVRSWSESASSVSNMLESSRPSGILFHGPSGNGKTLAAMCLASSLGLNCVKVRSSEVFSQWLGGSEATIRSIFSRARAAAPCILLFDELDSLAMNREQDNSSAASGVQSRILTTLLNEMDGITNAGSSQSVLVVAATNRLDSIDSALLRPGRLEEHVLLSYPDSSSILEIFKMRTAKMPLHDSVDLVQWSEILSNASASCAEVEGLCRDACLIAMRRCSDETSLTAMLSITDADVSEAFGLIRKNHQVT